MDKYSRKKNYLQLFVLFLLAGLLTGAGNARAQVSGHVVDDFSKLPLNESQAATPLVVLAASNDQQLFFKAYDDYSDLDGDGIPETTYKNSIDYYGYFDSYKCYTYDTSNKRFVPKAKTNDKYCTGSNDGYWSGNFLNWASMTRIDVVRKVLFGGHRRTDTSTGTVLERSYLPHDAHSFAKHYEGTDLQDLTPFANGTDYPCDASNPSSCTAPKDRGITICNTTDVSNSTDYSQDVTDPPLIKVVKGNYSLWAANERWQCTWASGAPVDNHNKSNANDSSKSGIYAYPSSPAYSEGIGAKDYVARVKACVSGLLGNEKCKEYPNGNYKPIGLLQVYGDDDQLHFAQIAGSYQKHAQGGILTYEMGSMSREINVTTDGTFSHVAKFAGGPAANNKAEGLINAWSLYRLYGYYHGSGVYNNVAGDNCKWGLSDPAVVTANGKCTNWGNPFSEIYLEALRYLTQDGTNVTANFTANDSTYIPGLNTPQNWSKAVVNSTNECANLSIVNFSSSASSYDWDDLDGNKGVKSLWFAADLPNGTATTAKDLTDLVGVGEGVNGKKYFIGETNVNNQADGDDQLCTAKTIASLGAAGGLCSEAPRLQGSYNVAGLAYYAHIRDFNQHTAGEQRVDTYSVALANSTPKITIKAPTTGHTVTIIPACRNTSLTPAGNCAIVDFKIVSQTATSGKFYVNWEDSEQGGDYDQDMWGTINYTINATNIAVTTEVDAKSTGFAMGFGYIISGTTEDGFHAHSGINGYTYTESASIIGGHDCSTVGTGCVNTDSASIAKYTLGASTANWLEDPLWYAAKWGGFKDTNNNDIPDLQIEWDKQDVNGVAGSDGVPDNYFFASNPGQLEKSLNRVFLAILNRTSSGTAAAVVSNNVRGEGALYQAFYEPRRQDANGNTVNWIGSVHALWMDKAGFMREDNGNDTLDDYVTDPVIETFFDTTANRTRVKRWTSSNANVFSADTFTTIELGDIRPIWDAREELSSLNNTAISTQRLYGNKADTGRYIMTWYDYNNDEIVDNSEYVDFVSSGITTSNYTFYDLATVADAQNLVNYIRGLEIPGYRNRTMDYDGDGFTEVQRLGDIINSTPTVVGKPSEGFNLLYRDSSYAQYLAKYQNRRNVLYVGANDGMLHAFNAGFFNPATLAFSVSGTKPDGTAATEHPLGSELWAYVPMNLQPHLQWLKDPLYSDKHVAYMDLKPRVFDAKIFFDGVDSVTQIDHPGGWGTVLVVGMRFGGGQMTIDTKGDGLGAPNGADDVTRSSAYVVMDVTDPELPPHLLGEIQPPDQSFTTVYPAVMTVKEKNAYTCPDDGSTYTGAIDCDNACTATCTNSDPNKWFLVFGSGPDEPLDSATPGISNSTAKLYIVDLDELNYPGTTTTMPSGCSLKSSGGGTIKIISCDTSVANQFVGTPVTADYNLDYRADDIYFGTVGDTASDTGGMYSMSIKGDPDPGNWDFPALLFDAAQPISAGATITVDSSNPLLANRWLFFGTGRMLVSADKTSTNIQSIYGLKLQKTVTCNVDSVTYYMLSDCTNFCSGSCISGGPSPISSTNLLDVTNLEIQTDGDVVWEPTGDTGQTALNYLGVTYDSTVDESYFAAVERHIDKNMDGWKMDLPAIQGTMGLAPATRVLNQQSLLGEILFSSVYQPNTDVCTSEGFSRLYGQYYRTGTALPYVHVFGTEIIGGKEVSSRFVELGFGLATSPALHTGGEGDRAASVFTQLSTGNIMRTLANTNSRVRSGMVSWELR